MLKQLVLATGALLLSSSLLAADNPKVLLTLVTGAVGFGGIFAIYSYFTSAFQATGAGPLRAADDTVRRGAIELPADNFDVSRPLSEIKPIQVMRNISS